MLLLLLLECKFISQIISKGYVYFDGGGVVSSLLNLTRANISDLFSICLHSKEFKFLQEGGLCAKKLTRKCFTSLKTGMSEWWASFIWEQGIGKYLKHVLKASNSTSHLFQSLWLMALLYKRWSSSAQGFVPVKGMALLSRLQRKCFKTGISVISFPGNHFGSDANLCTWLFWLKMGPRQGEAEGNTALGYCPPRGCQVGSAKSTLGSTLPWCQLALGFSIEVTRVWGWELETHFLFLVLTPREQRLGPANTHCGLS